jgi:hypothetical protein
MSPLKPRYSVSKTEKAEVLAEVSICSVRILRLLHLLTL